MNTLKFSEITQDDISLVGGKGLSLGIMKKNGIPVPDGFVVTADVYEFFSDSEMSEEVISEILGAFEALNTEFVAVRSSALSEDSAKNSWAGQLDSFLFVKKENLIESIKKCWLSLKSDRAKAYIQQNNLSEDQKIAVAVQKMIDSKKSGVMFTANPINKNTEEMIIESVYGLGELLVQGIVTPFNYVIDKSSLALKSTSPSDQEEMLVYQDNKTMEIPVPSGFSKETNLSEEELQELAKIGKQVEEFYKVPQDIEWVMDGNNFLIVQSRPITTLNI